MAAEAGLLGVWVQFYPPTVLTYLFTSKQVDPLTPHSCLCTAATNLLSYICGLSFFHLLFSLALKVGMLHNLLSAAATQAAAV